MIPHWHVLAERFRNRIFLRVFVVFGGLLVAMTVVYGLLIVPLQQQSLLKVMYSQAATVSRSIIQACSDAMLTDDFGFIVEHNLQVVQGNKNMQRIIIAPRAGGVMQITAKGWVLGEHQPHELPDTGLEAEKYGLVNDEDGSQHYRYAAPIRFSGVSWGAIQIDFDPDEYRASVAEMYRQLFYSSLVALLVMLPIGYIFARWLTRPIAHLNEAAARVAQGDLDVRVVVNRRDEIGQLSGSFNQMVDALQQNREKLQDYNLELEHEVAERTLELDEINHTLDQRVRHEIAKRKEQESLLIHQSRLAAMGEMIGNIAHQWRQPLNALSLVIQNIQMQHRMGQLTVESMQRMEEKATQLVQRMSTTIDDFRNFFKPSKHSERFCLAKNVSSALDIMEGMFRNHNIVLTMQCDDGIELFGVAGEFSQVVLNLVGNAKDAVIASRQSAPRILVRASRVGDRVRVDIEDNGGGIDPAYLDKIFEPYFTTKEEGKGSGIGLYMSKMIVENNMRGRLLATNTSGGACFTIDLPAPED